MTDTTSPYLQKKPVLEQPWGFNSGSFMEPFPPTASFARPALVSPPYSTNTASSVSQQSVGIIEDARAALKARYERMPNTAWFKAAHEGRSLGEAIKVTS